LRRLLPAPARAFVRRLRFDEARVRLFETRQVEDDVLEYLRPHLVGLARLSPHDAARRREQLGVVAYVLPGVRLQLDGAAAAVIRRELPGGVNPVCVETVDFPRVAVLLDQQVAVSERLKNLARRQTFGSFFVLLVLG